MKISPILREIQSICHSLDKASTLRTSDLGDHHGLRSAYRQLVLSALSAIRSLCDDIEHTLQLEAADIAPSNGHSTEDPFDTDPY